MSTPRLKPTAIKEPSKSQRVTLLYCGCWQEALASIAQVPGRQYKGLPRSSGLTSSSRVYFAETNSPFLDML